MTGVKALQSHFMSLSDNLKDDAPVATFKRTFSQDMDLQEKQLTKEILHETDCKTALTELRSLFENTFNSDLRLRLQNYTAFETIFIRDMIIGDMDFIKKYMIETILHQQEIQQLLNEQKLQTQEDHKSVKESSLDSATKDVHAIKYKMSKAKERCMAYFRSLHSHLQVLSKEDLKGTRIEHGFKWAFMSLFGQDADTFTSTMLLNFSLDYDSQMIDKYFAEYTGIEVKQFRETLLQHMNNVKKSVAERTRHQRQYDKRVNKRQMQTQESTVDTGKAVDADLVIIESSGTESVMMIWLV
ncbi:hypothetical protein Tco_1439589 [Tanacetum coccineum]